MTEQERLAEYARQGEAIAADFLGGDVEADMKSRITATPFTLRDPSQIPRRKWLCGTILQRGELTAIAAPSGVGKSTYVGGLGVELSTGIEFLGHRLHEGAVKVWVWNLEDDRTELERLITATALHHKIEAQHFDARLFVDGLDNSLCTARETSSGAEVIEPIFGAVTAELKARAIDALVIDPFVSSHAVNESDNGAIDMIAKRWKRVAQECDCAIILVHHTRKTGGHSVTVEDMRGASSLSGAVRTALVLNQMTESEADSFGITEKAERRTIIKVDNGKSNRAPPENAQWFKIHSVGLENGDWLNPGDFVGAAAKWTPPDAFDGVGLRELYAVQQAIAEGDWAQNVQAANWAGNVIAEVLGLDLEDRADKTRAARLLKGWIGNNSLKIEKRHNSKKGRDQPFVIVGNPVDLSEIPTSRNEVGAGGEVGQNSPSEPSPPHPLYRGGSGGVVREQAGQRGGETCASCSGVGCKWCQQ